MSTSKYDYSYTMKPTSNQLLEMLRESNAIEGVYNDDALRSSVEAWHYLLSYKRLSAKNIRETHRTLMSNSDLICHYQGVWRPIQVWVGDHTPPAPIILDALMEEWIMRANLLDNPIVDHIAFEAIHPFVDGNGRMGRLLMNWQLVKKKLPLQVYTAAERQEYYKLFRRASSSV